MTAIATRTLIFREEPSLRFSKIPLWESIMGILFYGLLVCAVVSHVDAMPPKRECFLDINRLLGSPGSYVWVCNCKNGLSPFRAEGRVTAPLPIGKADTVGRDEATLRCIEHNTQELTHTCFRNASRFLMDGAHALRRCTKEKLNDSEKKKIQPFTFSRSNCLSNEDASLAPKPEVFWLCKCVQPVGVIYNVVLRRVSFFTEFAPTSPRREALLIRKCLKPFTDQLQDQCKKNIGDFAIAASHSLETCCKQVRASSNAKFQCEDAAPDNVGSLKAT